MANHIPVLLNEAIEGLAIKPSGIYVDLTLGRAGHSSEILKRIPQGKLYCFDQDIEAIEESRSKLESIGSNFEIIHSNFEFVKDELAKRGVTEVDGILADLGVSSPQFDEARRGFSYREDAPLDMRMDRSQSLTAYQVVNGYSESDLRRILVTYGEENDASRIARKILKRRETSPITSTLELVEIIKEAKPNASLSKKGHPAKQTFQALRIEVNHELQALESMLVDAPYLLRQEGRLAIITFMSLDDRVVKHRFQELAVKQGSRNNVPLLPSEIEDPEFALPVRHPIVPSPQELEDNHRAKSAKLRLLERRRKE